jgi:hypothetical protein
MFTVRQLSTRIKKNQSNLYKKGDSNTDVDLLPSIEYATRICSLLKQTKLLCQKPLQIK